MRVSKEIVLYGSGFLASQIISSRVRKEPLVVDGLGEIIYSTWSVTKISLVKGIFTNTRINKSLAKLGQRISYKVCFRDVPRQYKALSDSHSFPRQSQASSANYPPRLS
jgi:hypothetical protein